MSHTNFGEYTELLNTQLTTISTGSLDVSGQTTVGFQVVLASGTVSACVLTLQASMDNTNWVDTAATVTGVGMSASIPISARYIKVYVTSGEGVTSSANIFIQGK